MTTITATARARLFAKNSAEMKPIGKIDTELNHWVNNGTNKAMIGVRIIKPTILTTENWVNCCAIGFDLESG